MLCEARHTLHFGLLRTKVKRSPGWVLAHTAVDGGNIKNHPFIAQQVRCCMLHGNALRKALVVSQFANENVEVLHDSCNLPNSHDHSGTVLEYEPGVLCPSPLPSWCLADPKEKYQGGTRVCITL